jgi:hypothetical protein
MNDVPEAGMYDIGWSPKKDTTDLQFETVRSGKKSRMITIDGNNFEVPNREYIDELEKKIVAMDKELKEMRNLINRMSGHNNKLVEMINATRRELDNKVDLIERE